MKKREEEEKVNIYFLRNPNCTVICVITIVLEFRANGYPYFACIWSTPNFSSPLLSLLLELSFSIHWGFSPLSLFLLRCFLLLRDFVAEFCFAACLILFPLLILNLFQLSNAVLFVALITAITEGHVLMVWFLVFWGSFHVDLVAFYLFPILRFSSDGGFSSDEWVFCFLTIFLWFFCFVLVLMLLHWSTWWCRMGKFEWRSNDYGCVCEKRIAAVVCEDWRQLDWFSVVLTWLKTSVFYLMITADSWILLACCWHTRMCYAFNFCELQVFFFSSLVYIFEAANIFVIVRKIIYW